jgi:hypothetical protein
MKVGHGFFLPFGVRTPRSGGQPGAASGGFNAVFRQGEKRKKLCSTTIVSLPDCQRL